MRNHRSSIVIFSILLLFVTACQQSEAPPIDDIVGNISTNNLTYDISLEQQWISPNPGERWTVGGRELQVTNDISVRIIIRLEPKVVVNQDFEDALATITANELTIGETENSERYAQGITEVDSYVIYRDYPETVVRIELIDAVLNDIDPLYINDWERIALEGGLLTLE